MITELKMQNGAREDPRAPFDVILEYVLPYPRFEVA